MPTLKRIQTSTATALVAATTVFAVGTDACGTTNPNDVNNDGIVDFLDAELISTAGNLLIGVAAPGSDTRDVDSNNIINRDDLASVLADPQLDRSPGDFNDDGGTSIFDFGPLATHWRGSFDLIDEGDADGDGFVGPSDFAHYAHNFGQTGFGNGYAPDAAPNGVLTLTVDKNTGTLSVAGTVTDAIALMITSDAGSIMPGAESPMFIRLASSTNETTVVTFADTDLTGGLTFGSTYDTTVNVMDLQFSWLESGNAVEHTGAVVYVPEPTSLALLGLGGLLFAMRRRG